MIENKRMSLDDVEVAEHYKDCLFSYSSGSLHFSEVTFENCEFQQTEFSRSEWLDCQFIHMDLSNNVINESFFYRCTFDNCQLMGVDFSGNKWKSNKVVACKGDYVSFSCASIENCSFVETSLRESFFQEVKIKKGLKFDNCLLNQADFLETHLAGVDFSKSLFDSVIFSPELLKGCTINHIQATNLIALLGVKVNDD